MATVEIHRQYEFDSYENTSSLAGLLRIRPEGSKHEFQIGNIRSSGSLTWSANTASSTEGVERFYFVVSDQEQSQAESQDGLADQNSQFLRMVYLLDECGRDREAAEMALDRLDDLLNAGDIYKCNGILRTAHADKLSDLSIVTFLGTTLAAKSNLSARASFFDASYSVVARRHGGERAANLLNKYR